MSNQRRYPEEVRLRFDILQMLIRKLDERDLANGFIMSSGSFVTVAWHGPDTIHRQLQLVVTPIKDLPYTLPFVGATGQAFQRDNRGRIAWVRLFGEPMTLRLSATSAEEIIDRLIDDLNRVGEGSIDV